MANKSTTARVSRRDGELTVQQHETDSPILPVAQLERLQQFRPDAVDLVLEQTRTEAEHRRKQDSRVNVFIFIERVLGQLFGLLIGAAGIGGGVYASLHGEAWAGAAIATAAIGSLAVVFVTGRKNKP